MAIRDLFEHKYPLTNLHELDLSWMLEEFDKMIDVLASWEQVINELQADIAKIDGMQSDIAALKAATSDLPEIRNNIKTLQYNISKLQQRIDSLDNIQDALYSYISREIVILRDLIDLNYNRLLDKFNWLKLAYTGDIEALKLDIQSKYLELLSLINEERPVDVYNRVAGVRLSFDDNNFNIYEDLRYLGIDNNTLYELTDNDEVASLVHNNRDFALFMKLRLKKYYMYSPLSGRFMSHSNALSELAALGWGGCSNQELYEAMLAEGQTNEDYDEYYDHNIHRFSLTL